METSAPEQESHILERAFLALEQCDIFQFLSKKFEKSRVFTIIIGNTGTYKSPYDHSGFAPL